MKSVVTHLCRLHYSLAQRTAYPTCKYTSTRSAHQRPQVQVPTRTCTLTEITLGYASRAARVQLRARAAAQPPPEGHTTGESHSHTHWIARYTLFQQDPRTTSSSECWGASHGCVFSRKCFGAILASVLDLFLSLLAKRLQRRNILEVGDPYFACWTLTSTNAPLRAHLKKISWGVL